jgi:hypothetical protein
MSTSAKLDEAGTPGQQQDFASSCFGVDVCTAGMPGDYSQRRLPILLIQDSPSYPCGGPGAAADETNFAQYFAIQKQNTNEQAGKPAIYPTI